jgi:hypothetical protein
VSVKDLCAFCFFNVPDSDGAVGGPRDEDVVEVLEGPDAAVVAVQGVR